MSNLYLHPQETYLVSHGNQLSGSASSPAPRTLEWLLQQHTEKQSPHPSSPQIMIHSAFPSSQDDILGQEYTFTQESADGPWSTQIYPPEELQIQLNGSANEHPSAIYTDADWNPYPNYRSPHDANPSSSAFMMNYSPNSTNSLSPFVMHPRTPSSLPQLSPASSDPSLSPLLYPSSSLSTPTTPGSTSRSFLPSPTLSQSDHMQQQDAQISVTDSDRLLYTHREQLQFFRDALSLHREGAGPFIPQLMYKPHTTSDRKRYVEDVRLEAPIYFFVDHSDQCGISLIDALHSRVKNLVNRDHVVFEGRGPSVSIRLEWPGYRQWSRQIPTKDFRSPPGPITIAKLAKNVAKCVQRFMADRKSLAMEEGADERWRIGDRPNDIKLEDLMLVSIHHVSLGSWQPHLRLRRPQLHIPIQSSHLGSSAVNNILYPFSG